MKKVRAATAFGAHWRTVLAISAAAVLGACGGGEGVPVATAQALTGAQAQGLVPAATTGVGAATVQWAAPLTRADGQPNTQTWVGYRVRYGMAPGQALGSVLVPGTATQATVTGLGPGTWYFSVVAVDTAGLESNPSHEVSKTL